MAIASVYLQNFRSYKDSSFEFEPGVNIVVGPNGSGKTNLLEALLMVSRGSSYRGKDHQLIKFEADWARIDCWLDNSDQKTLKIKRLDDEKAEKTFELAGKTFSRLSRERQMPVVLFEPNHLQLIQAEPAYRREYLDDLSSQFFAPAIADLRAFKRVLAQRNSLLKSQAPTSQFFAWDIQFVQLAEKIVKNRLEMIESLNKKLKSTYKQLGGEVKKLELQYSSKVNIENYSDNLMKRLAEARPRELETGFTLYGPQRDDFVVLFDGIDARTRTSRGENRTILLALKIIEIEIMSLNKKPLMLLDDVFSELDGRRRRALAERLKNYQTFITTTDADVVVEHFQNTATIIPIS